MMTLDEAEAHLGDLVSYAPDPDHIEYGKITEVRRWRADPAYPAGGYVFVAYVGDHGAAKATTPDLLTLELSWH